METATPGTGNQSSHDAENYMGQMRTLVEQIIQLGRFNLTVNSRRVAADSIEPDAPEWVVELSGADSDLLLEGKAALLDAFAYVVSKAVRLDDSLQKKIVFDCRGYRKMRTEELKLTARLAAERVIESGEPFALNPMNPADRRTIHLALKDQPSVRTESQGTGLARHIVILPRTNRDERPETSQEAKSRRR